MKSPFNREIDLYFGLGSSGGGSLKAEGIPARIVPDVFFREVDSPYSSIVAYCTMDQGEIVPSGPSWSYSAGGLWTADFSMADRLGTVPEEEPEWVVARVETCIPTVGEPYYRLHLVAPYVSADVGCELYVISPLSRYLYRTGPLSWADEEESCFLTTDGEGSWSCLGIDGLVVYSLEGWDGEGTNTLFSEEDPEDFQYITCSE